MKNKIKECLEVCNLKPLLLMSEGWVVGSAINNIINDEPVKDYDIIVPSRELFQLCYLHLSTLFSVDCNSYGGVKVNMGEISVDIWCEELSHFLLAANKITYIYNFKKNLLLEIN